MPYSEVLYAIKNRVATITLNRPDKLNAWTSRMEEEVNAALHEAAADGGVRVILLTGAGRAFCAGADMSLLTEAADSGGVRRVLPTQAPVSDDGLRADFRKKYAWLTSIGKPVVAAIHGPAVGLGFIIPLYCDFRIASTAARFSTIFAKRGLIAEFGLAWILPRLIGLSSAIDLLFTARTIDAAEAHRLGLVQRIFAESGFAEAAQTFAEELGTSVSPRSLRVVKEQVYNAQFETLAEAFDRASREMVESLASEDFREGVRHYLEKRTASFTGR